MNFEGADFRLYLRKVLAEKCARNPKYSLRAFARKIGLSPSHLSRVTNGSAGISIAAAYKLALGLDLSTEETKSFVELVGLERANDFLGLEWS